MQLQLGLASESHCQVGFPSFLQYSGICFPLSNFLSWVIIFGSVPSSFFLLPSFPVSISYISFHFPFIFFAIQTPSSSRRIKMAFIDTALVDLKLLTNMASNISSGLRWPVVAPLNLLKNAIPTLMCRLSNIKTFILCVRKLGNDMLLRTETDNNRNKESTMGSLLVRIEEVVCRNAQGIHFYCRSLEVGSAMDVVDKIRRFTVDIDSFEKEVEEWYIALTDFLQQSISPITTVDEMIAITDSILENLVDIVARFEHFERVLVMEPLIEQIKFLKSFICFAMLQSVEHRLLEDMLNHSEVLAVNIACISFKCQYKGYDEKWRKVMQLQISVLVQKIKPVNPDVYATYAQALATSKLSRQLHAPVLDMDHDPRIITKDFIDSLICLLWEILQLDTSPVSPIKSQLQVLHEGLRSLRTILVEQPNKFDERLKDFMGVLICDAGLIIFSLYQKDVKVDVELPDVLKRIEHIQQEVGEKDPEASTSNFSRTDGLGFIEYLIENLNDVTSIKPGSNSQNCARTIQEELVFLRSILVDIVDLHNEVEEFLSLWNRILQVAERVEFLIDQLVVGDISNSFAVCFDCIREEITNIKTDASKIIPSKGQDIKVNKVAKKSSLVPALSSLSIINEVVGFNDESASITDRLKRGSRNLRIIAVVGMPGQGKTTLARKVYDSPIVIHHFHVRALCSISQVFDKRKVLLELLSQFVPELPEIYFVMSEQDLDEELRHRLKGRRYLIFLDDVWDIQVWNGLALSLPDDSNGSRIMLTSRLRDVAPGAMLDEEPHVLRELTKDESWELLQRKLLLCNDCPPELNEIGMQIAENCKGLPLTIVIVAGLLANMELENWNEILESLSSGNLSTATQCMNILELSYKNLPDYLKPCFLYFGLFPEDQEISTKKLVWLWIAEGFVQKSKSRSMEDVAADYLVDLISRSLVLVAQRRSIGGLKACRVHDLLHDFCITKSKTENFCQILRGYDALLAFNEACNPRRLGIQSEPKQFKESRLFCPRVRSLHFFSHIKWSSQTALDISFVIHIFKLLKVLDIGEIHFGSVFPSEIGLLVQLRYLAVRGKIKAIPSSIGSLSFLETFILDSLSEMVLFPETFWNLKKLRHVCVGVRSYSFDGFSFDIENLENCPDLLELESCSGAIIFYRDGMERQMKKFPNVRKLKCKLFQLWDDAEYCDRIVVPDFLSRLESLTMSQFDLEGDDGKWVRRKRVDFEFCLPTNLKKLTLSGFWLPWSKISSIGKLPNLEVLKLLCDSFSGEKIWDMEEGEFPRLRFLKLSAVGIVKWTASDDQFPHLQKLVVESCNFLKEIPSRALENASTLEMIHLSRCLHSLTSLVEQIQEEQMNMGNSDLKIFAVEEFEY